MAKYFKTVFQVTVLSAGEYSPESLASIARDIFEGDCSGQWEQVSQEEVTATQMSELLKAQGSDPAFLLGDPEHD